MEFNTLFFIFIYLPLFIGIMYFIKNNKIRNIIVIIFSLFFYYSGCKQYFLLLILISLITYLFARKVKGNSIVYVLYLIIMIGTLALFKYHQTIVNILIKIGTGAVFSELIMPLGVSFYTFTAISYVSDVYYEKYDYEKNYFNILSFLTFFPVVVSGPLIRYDNYKSFLNNKEISADGISEGLRRFIIGLAKKMIIANQAANVVAKLFAVDTKLNFALAWYALIAYAIQSFFDFSGYTDMAIGIGQMIGYKLPENFDNPYFSHSISEYWRRWHMTLGAWFKDYVFYPLLGSKFLQTISKKFNNKKVGRNIAKVLALLVVWLLTGMWHGATINYIFWGLFNGFFIILEVLLESKYKSLKTFFHIDDKTKVWKAFQIIRTNFLLMFKNLLAKCTGVAQIGYFIKCCLGFNGFVNIVYVRQLNVLYILYFVIIGIIFLFPFVHKIIDKLKNRFLVLYDVSLLIIMFISICYIVSGSYSSFLYFNF